MNRQQIRTKVKALLNRNDCTDELANDFIDMAQTRIERTLRTPGQEKISITTGNSLPIPTDQFVIPADFLELKSLYTVEGGTLVYKELGTFFKLPKVQGCPPKYYTRVGGSYLLSPSIPSGVSLYAYYYAAQKNLSADTDTNLFTQVCSDLLIYASLCFAADHFVDDRVAGFESRYELLLGELNEQARQTDMQQSSMSIEPAYGSEY
jgi:hypothetical protein